MRYQIAVLLLTISPLAAQVREKVADELLTVDSGIVKVGINKAKGGSVTWLSWKGNPKNAVNAHDPGRLIQQSYYAGKRLDRRKEGQHEAWSPWSWNPIQGGGVGSWARVTRFERRDAATLFSETVPKLWDMQDEEAAAVMRQWTGFEKGMPDVVRVRCEFIAGRKEGDRWGGKSRSPQEIPATYFTRNFDSFKSYLGDGKWRDETTRPGPPWSHSGSPRVAMACFNAEGQGIAVFSPGAEQWNFGPHGKGKSDESLAGPCVHIAPVAVLEIGPRSTLRYRYWLVTGTQRTITGRLDALRKKYGDEKVEVSLSAE